MPFSSAYVPRSVPPGSNEYFSLSEWKCMLQAGHLLRWITPLVLAPAREHRRQVVRVPLEPGVRRVVDHLRHDFPPRLTIRSSLAFDEDRNRAPVTNRWSSSMPATFASRMSS